MDKLKWVCDYNSYDGTNLSFEKDRAYGFSWPQRNYRCSFCKKEFKSAQALGGHMNVHRRDRARLRLSPSPNPNLNPNPNPIRNPSLSKPSFVPAYNMESCSSFAAEEKKNEAGTRVDFATRKEDRVWKAKNHELIRLDLNLGLGLGLFQDANDDLDLELRLGSS
ncbi:hypothetical protein ACS0TY_007360 [Phlomoides rotata]